jgi:hypothetical protein
MGCGWSNMVPTLVPRDRVSIGGRDHAIRNVSMCAAAGALLAVLDRPLHADRDAGLDLADELNPTIVSASQTPRGRGRQGPRELPDQSADCRRSACSVPLGGRRVFPGRLAACSGPCEQLIDCAMSLIA